ncbi:rhamnan synthesis F family protein [Frigidibacter sp. SD6-1]|uniref:rhamnan synthesis F family protein n=1 Tax=Frigidibacter sp. SD6-1 TaxID=3032581 RepID=UPI0024DFCF21|nr:rhamnan synthesis F family protein [Frigidibacter sp. SD6-1]
MSNKMSLSTFGRKARREVRRIGLQLNNLPYRLFESTFVQLHYDLTKSYRTQTTSGRMELRDKCAVYLIYPQDGVAASHFLALDYLAASGYAPVVVSNLPLTAEARRALAEKSHVVIERPNFGYDFGGYRDGILFLKDRLQGLQHLALLNDSVWFPLPGSYDWLKRMERSGKDFWASIWAWAVPKREPEDFRRIDWRIDKTRRHFHYASFALGFSGKVLRDAGFAQFWRSLRLTSDKDLTVRRGEMGLTRWILHNGYSHAAASEMADLPSILSSLSDREVRRVFDELISVNDPDMSAFRRQYAAQIDVRTADRADLEKIILCSVARQGASYAIAGLLTRKLGFPFLKKSPCTAGPESARVMLAIANHLSWMGDSCISSEIRAQVEKAVQENVPAVQEFRLAS